MTRIQASHMTRLQASLRTLAVVLATLALVGAACGQKPEVMEYYAGQGGGPGGGIGTDDGFMIDPETGEIIEDGSAAGDGGTGDGASGTDGSTGSGAGGDAGGADGSGDGGSADGGSGDRGGSAGGDTTGVTDKEIVIGVHAPVTGAAAFPQQSFRNGVGVYADFINSKGGIHGRKLRVIFEDDKFNPNTARSVCQKMAEQDKAFLLIGGGGSDQIDACARYAASAGVPYLSGGVHESRPRLGSIATSTYFAASMTYEQQIPLLVNLIRGDHKGAKIALLVADNDGLDNFYAKTDSALKGAFGGDVVLSRRVPKETGARDAPEIGRQVCASGADVAIWQASPSGLINVSKAMVCNVTWMGPGVTNGLNIVATAGCPQIDGAQYFSSFPGLDRIDSMDSDFRGAYQRKNGSAPDDIGIALWGLEKLVSQMLADSGKDLTREKFISTLPGSSYNNGVFPAVRYANTRFGGTAMHLLEADCNSRQYKTKRTNVGP